MAIGTPNQLLAALPASQWYSIEKQTSVPAGGGAMHSLWTDNGDPAAASTPPSGAGAVCDRNTAGAAPFGQPAGGALLYIAGASLLVPTYNGALLLVDRLWHCASLSMAITTQQVINSAANPRGSSGAGCELYLECHSAWGATATTITVNYTDGNGQSRTATFSLPASSGTLRRSFRIPTIDGVSSVQSFQLSGSTGAAGNAGLAIVRRLGVIKFTAGVPTQLDAYGIGFPVVDYGACLTGYLRTITAAAHTVSLDINLASG